MGNCAVEAERATDWGVAVDGGLARFMDMVAHLMGEWCGSCRMSRLMSGRVAKLMKPPRYACSNLYGVEDCTSRKQAEAKTISNYRKWRNAGRLRQLSFATFGYPTEKPIPFIFRASLMIQKRRT